MTKNTIMFTNPERAQDKTIELILHNVYNALEEKEREEFKREKELKYKNAQNGECV